MKSVYKIQGEHAIRHSIRRQDCMSSVIFWHLKISSVHRHKTQLAIIYCACAHSVSISQSKIRSELQSTILSTIQGPGL